MPWWKTSSEVVAFKKIRKKMKQYIVVVILVAFFEVEAFSPRNDLLRKAFLNISNDLSQRNYLVSVVEGGDSSEKSDSALFNLTASLPHVVA